MVGGILLAWLVGLGSLVAVQAPPAPREKDRRSLQDRHSAVVASTKTLQQVDGGCSEGQSEGGRKGEREGSLTPLLATGATAGTPSSALRSCSVSEAQALGFPQDRGGQRCGAGVLPLGP